MIQQEKKHANNHYELELTNGTLHVFANEEVYSSLEEKVYEMANNNLQIPKNVYMSYTPDAHVGVGTCIGTTAVWREKDGFISPSIVGNDIGCGMRVHLTNLHKQDIQDKKIRRKIIHAIEKYVPTNEQSHTSYEDIILSEVVQHGLHGLPKHYIPSEQWLTHVEQSTFRFDHSFLDRLPPKLQKNSIGKLGTLGGGNHFCEIQYIEIAEENREIAEKWGLFDGQVVVMIHSGSRSWGAGVGRELTKEIKDMMELWGIKNPDPNLAYAPLASHEGQSYLNVMCSALNFAVSNRHMIAFGVCKAFQDVFGADFQMPVLYDLMHNYALKEFHREQSFIVHRKGATRALPPKHFSNPPAYKETGHPAIIPGSMGTASFIMVGQEGGAKNFYSICHGAGRIRSRTATKKLVTIDEFEQALKIGTEEEILVNQRSLESILDECPQAYKDVDQIIDSVVGANLASVVAICKPMVAIKGVETRGWRKKK